VVSELVIRAVLTPDLAAAAAASQPACPAPITITSKFFSKFIWGLYIPLTQKIRYFYAIFRYKNL
jgi:hypothetical protein